MLPYTLDNHFSFGYDGKVFNINDASPHLDFNCYYSRAKYIPTSFREECVKTAESLMYAAKDLQRTPVILLSGGMDSHIVVKAFAELDCNFHTATNRFSYDTNSHELIYVENLKSLHNLSHEYYEIDIEDWLFSDEAMHMAKQGLCAYPQMLPTMKLMQHIWDSGGMPILGNGDLYIARDVNPQWRLFDKSKNMWVWNYYEYEYILAWFRYAIANNILGGLGFFQHNAEITLAMALEEKIYSVCTDRNPYKMSSRSTKYEIYQKWWPNIEPRQKYHGGEKISGLCDTIRKNILLPLYGDFERTWTLPFTEFLEAMKPL